MRGTIKMCGITQQEIAKRLGVSQSYIANKLRLLKLSPDERAEAEARGLNERHARALLGLKTADDMEKAAYQVMQQGLTVRQTEELVKNFYRVREKTEKQPDIYVRQLERDMSASTGHKITISHGAKKGRLVVEYYGNEDLEAVCAALRQIRK